MLDEKRIMCNLWEVYEVFKHGSDGYPLGVFGDQDIINNDQFFLCVALILCIWGKYIFEAKNCYPAWVIVQLKKF